DDPHQVRRRDGRGLSGGTGMDEAVVPKIGLALSGGGSRAIAFHLGCLSALNRLGLLDRVAILSTVSGGSVIGACFHAHFYARGGNFASFEPTILRLWDANFAARNTAAAALRRPRKRATPGSKLLSPAFALKICGRF